MELFLTRLKDIGTFLAVFAVTAVVLGGFVLLMTYLVSLNEDVSEFIIRWITLVGIGVLLYKGVYWLFIEPFRKTTKE